MLLCLLCRRARSAEACRILAGSTAWGPASPPLVTSPPAQTPASGISHAEAHVLANIGSPGGSAATSHQTTSDLTRPYLPAPPTPDTARQQATPAHAQQQQQQQQQRPQSLAQDVLAILHPQQQPQHSAGYPPVSSHPPQAINPDLSAGYPPAGSYTMQHERQRYQQSYHQTQQQPQQQQPQQQQQQAHTGYPPAGAVYPVSSYASQAPDLHHRPPHQQNLQQVLQATKAAGPTGEPTLRTERNPPVTAHPAWRCYLSQHGVQMLCTQVGACLTISSQAIPYLLPEHAPHVLVFHMLTFLIRIM